MSKKRARKADKSLEGEPAKKKKNFKPTLEQILASMPTRTKLGPVTAERAAMLEASYEDRGFGEAGPPLVVSLEVMNETFTSSGHIVEQIKERRLEESKARGMSGKAGDSRGSLFTVAPNADELRACADFLFFNRMVTFRKFLSEITVPLLCWKYWVVLPIPKPSNEPMATRVPLSLPKKCLTASRRIGKWSTLSERRKILGVAKVMIHGDKGAGRKIEGRECTPLRRSPLSSIVLTADEDLGEEAMHAE